MEYKEYTDLINKAGSKDQLVGYFSIEFNSFVQDVEVPVGKDDQGHYIRIRGRRITVWPSIDYDLSVYKVSYNFVRFV